MNYSRFQEPKPERDYSGVQAELEFDTIEIEPGHMFSIQLSGVFEWDGHNWIADRLYLHTYREERYWRDFDGNKFPAMRLVDGVLRIDDMPQFKVFVEAAQKYADANFSPEDYA